MRFRYDQWLRALGIIAILYFAQSVILPVALAIVIGLALTPLVDHLCRLHLPRTLAVVVSVAMAVGLLVGVGWLSASQIGQLAQKLPQYREPILAKTRVLGPLGGLLRDSFQNFEQTVGEASSDGAAPKPEGAPGPSGSSAGSLEAVRNLAKTLLGTLGNVVIIIVLLLLFLLHQKDLRSRLLRLLGERGIVLSGPTVQEAGRKVTRYLLTEFFVNAAYGGVIVLGTWILKVPQPLFWGLLAFLFRFIPYIGTWLVAALALVLSLALSPTWTSPALLIGFWFILELITADLVEPWVYGRRTGITAFGVMISALFWSWLWGIAGLMIATPLTACLVELGGEIPGIRWLNTLFGEPPASVILRADDVPSPLPAESRP